VDGRRGGAELPWRKSAAPARKALCQWQARNDKRMLAVMTADRPGTMLNDVTAGQPTEGWVREALLRVVGRA
jgi:hypothetical protein